MGSPFSVCDVLITGDWTPDLSGQEWQDRVATSPDGRLTALVRWDTRGNDPGFRVVTLDAERETISESDRVPGCCERLFWSGGGFSYDRWP